MRTVPGNGWRSSTVMRRVPALLLGMVLLPAPLLAADVASLYTAEVQLDPADPDAREEAYEDALRQILIRITGSEQAALAPELIELFPSPGRYVLQFQPGPDNTMRVSMDGAAIEKIVRQTGFPVWGSDRPVTMLWLAVDRGGGDRELITAENPDEEPDDPRAAEHNRQLLERVQSAARDRGVPLVLPDLDAGSFNDVGYTDVWGGFHDRLLEVSRQNGADAMLVGRLRPGLGERNRWSFYFGDQQRDWNGEPEEAVYNLADTLAGQLAVAGNSRLEEISLTVSGVDSVQAYGEVQRTIAGLQPIERVRIENVSGDSIRYRIAISGGTGRLGSALEFSGKLRRATAPPKPAVGGDDRDSAALHYVYAP